MSDPAPGYTDSYRPLPVAAVVRFAAMTTNERPILDLYLDGALLLHDLVVPYSLGYRPSEETLLATAQRLLATIDTLSSSDGVPGRTVVRYLQSNIEAIGRLDDRSTEVVGRYIVAATSSEPARLASPDAVGSADAADDYGRQLDSVRRSAARSMSAIQFEYALIWTCLTEAGVTAAIDTERAVRQLEGWATETMGDADPV